MAKYHHASRMNHPFFMGKNPPGGAPGDDRRAAGWLGLLPAHQCPGPKFDRGKGGGHPVEERRWTWEECGKMMEK